MRTRTMTNSWLLSGNQTWQPGESPKEMEGLMGKLLGNSPPNHIGVNELISSDPWLKQRTTTYCRHL